MKVVVKGHHMSVTDALKEYAESKVTHIENFKDHIESITIDLDIDHSSADDSQQKASILVHVRGSFLQASECSHSMYASIDVVMDKMYLQLKKYKDKSNDHRHDPKHLTFPETNRPERSFSKANNNQSKGPRFIKQPMEPEEAADLLDRENIDIIAFRNLSDEQINIIYRMTEKHTFGLIEAT